MFSRRYISLLFILTGFVLRTQAQSPTTTANYVMVQVPSEEMTVLSGDYTKIRTSISYVDGLGKPIQQVLYKAGAGGNNDIVQAHQTYDKFGRPEKTFTTYGNVGNGGISPIPTAIFGDTAAYTKITEYDNSPLNRPTKSFGVGQAWRVANKFTQMSYGAGGNELTRFVVQSNGTVSGSSTFSASSLYKQTSTSERGFNTLTFTDKLGRMVAKAQQVDGGTYLVTAYIYDRQNRVIFVIPPEAYRQFGAGSEQTSNFTENDVIFKELIFAYKYDNAGKQIRKHTPGGGWTDYVYDKNFREVMRADESDLANGYWHFTQYDIFSRPLRTGIRKGMGTVSRSTLQTAFDGMSTETYEERGTSLLGYTNRSFPTTYAIADSNVREVIYYDDYGFLATSDTAYVFKSGKAYYPQGLAKGMITGKLVRNVETKAWYKIVNYTDFKGRISQQFTQNNVGGVDRIDYQYRFNDELLKMRMTHQKTGAKDLIEISEYQYDHALRKITYTHNSKSIIKLSYDAIGRLVGKRFSPSGTTQSSKQTGDWTDASNWLSGILPNVNDNVTINTGHTLTIPNGEMAGAGTLNDRGILKNFGTLNMGKYSTADLYVQSLSYHIRNDLRGIDLDANENLKNTLFSFKLEYEGNNGFFDGNIRNQYWKSSIDGIKRAYEFSYDGASRLTGAAYGSEKSGESYALENITYDYNGNVKTLNRKGKTGADSWDYIDQLTYNYQTNSNKLNKVTDLQGLTNLNVGDFRDSSNVATEYTYNADGSMATDDNKKVSIEWNYLKRPKKITKGSQWEKFQYDAEGTLLRTETSAGKIIDFVGNKTYQNGVLYQISHDEGRINSLGQYEYDILDHAKNLRVTFRDSSGIAKIVTKLDYDPWGLRLKGLDYYANYQTFNKFKTFSGKQLHDDFGFNLLSYKFRFHDPALGRFISLDPLSEQYPHNSTFAFAENKLGLGMEYEGLELAPFPFPIFGKAPPVMIEPAISRPVIEPITRLAPIENVTKLGEVNSLKAPKTRYSPETLEKFAEGRKVEVEQLAKSGQDKNTTPYKAIDPKTGKEGTTIPDAMRPNGGTTEVKFVKNQPLDKQLRLQNEVSKAAGVKPELIINQSAKITKPVRDLFDIKTYTAPPVSSDATRVAPTIKVQGTNPCKDNPNCL